MEHLDRAHLEQKSQKHLAYARSILDNGFQPGVLMIDDTRQEGYGLWNFHPGRFLDPRKMMDELHAMGFKVMLWICPFINAHCKTLISICTTTILNETAC